MGVNASTPASTYPHDNSSNYHHNHHSNSGNHNPHGHKTSHKPSSTSENVLLLRNPNPPPHSPSHNHLPSLLSPLTTNNTSTSSTTTNTNDGDDDDPLATHIARDLPHHVVERRLGPSSGRMTSTYRVRHVDSGATSVLKAVAVTVVTTISVKEETDAVKDAGVTSPSLTLGTETQAVTVSSVGKRRDGVEWDGGVGTNCDGPMDGTDGGKDPINVLDTGTNHGLENKGVTMESNTKNESNSNSSTKNNTPNINTAQTITTPTPTTTNTTTTNNNHNTPSSSSSSTTTKTSKRSITTIHNPTKNTSTALPPPPRERGTITRNELIALEQELERTLRRLRPPSPPPPPPSDTTTNNNNTTNTNNNDKNDTHPTSSTLLSESPYPNTLPYHSWFSSPLSPPVTTTHSTTRTLSRPSSLPSSSSSKTTTQTTNTTTTVTTTITTTSSTTTLYLLRPHCCSTLRTRVQTRPFLIHSEKVFLVFQCLRALDTLHKSGMVHGNLTSGNVGLSSWNWVVFLDLLPVGGSDGSDGSGESGFGGRGGEKGAAFDGGGGGGRPVVVPDDDPSDWVYYFQERAVGLRRFVDSTDKNTGGTAGGGTNSSGGGGSGTNTGGGGGGTSGVGDGGVLDSGVGGIGSGSDRDKKGGTGIDSVGDGVDGKNMGMGGTGGGIGSIGGAGNDVVSDRTASKTTGGSATTSVNDERKRNARSTGSAEKRCYLAPERFVSKSSMKTMTSPMTNNPAIEFSSSSQSNKATTSNTKSSNPIHNTKPPTTLTPAMDIFSLGCILLELFLDGEPAFDLGDLVEYRRSGGDVSAHSSLPQKLNRIESSSIRACVRHMLHLDPAKRLGAGEYLDRLTEARKEEEEEVSSVVAAEKKKKKEEEKEGTLGEEGSTTRAMVTKMKTPPPTPPVPACHETFFYPFFRRIRCEVLSPDARIALAAISYGKVLKATVGVKDVWGEARFRAAVDRTVMELEAEREGEGYREEKRKKGEEKNGESKRRHEGKEDSLEPTIVSFNDFKDDNYQRLLADTEKLLKQIETRTAFSDGSFSDDDDEDDDIDIGDGTDVRFGDQKEEIGPTDATSKSIERKEEQNALSPQTTSVSTTTSSGALVIFVQFILTTIRHTRLPSSKTTAILLLLRLSQYSTDEVRLQRIVPTLVFTLHDPSPPVRAMAIKALTEVLAALNDFSPSDARLFPRYVWTRVGRLASDEITVVRVAFAESVAVLAETAKRFLDVRHAIELYETVDGGSGGGNNDGGRGGDDEDESRKAIDMSMRSVESAFGDGAAANLLGSPVTNPRDKTSGGGTKRRNGGGAGIAEDGGTSRDTYATTPSATTLVRSDYDRDLADLHETVARWFVSIATDASDRSSALKHALLNDVARLCNFFGRDGVMACVLPQVLAFLNHRKDWQLRASLCVHLPSICAVVGRAATEQFVVPCVETALIDEQELVIGDALRCLASLVETGLLTRATLLGSPRTTKSSSNTTTTLETKRGGNDVGILRKYSALLIHPSGDVRRAAAFLVASCRQSLGFPDDEALLLPLVRPFLRFDVMGDRLGTVQGVESCLMPPLTEQELGLESVRPVSSSSSSSSSLSNGRGERYGSVEAEKLITLVRSYHGDERCFEGYVESLEGYLSLLRRNRGSDGNHSSSNNEERSLRILNDGIQGIHKAAFSYYLPNQKYAELLTKPLPSWYDEIRHVASSDPYLESEYSSLRTTTSLSKVFGLTIVQPTNVSDPRCGWNTDVESDPSLLPASMAEHNSDGGGGVANETSTITNVLENYLRSAESRAFGAATNGEWGALSLVDPALTQISNHVSKIVSLDIPPIPPQLGVLRDRDGRPYSCHASPHDSGTTTTDTNHRRTTTATTMEWKPRVDALLCSSPAYEHSGPITKLAVAQDQSFFVSASHDGTCKVWETRQIEDSPGDLRSCLAYEGQNLCASSSPEAPASLSSRVRINDVCVVENSHSVASGGSDGSVHVWRVDTVPNDVRTTPSTSSSSNPTSTSSFSLPAFGCTSLRRVDPSEGEILTVSHFNTPGASILAFATQNGYIRSWDLRCAREPFALRIRPEYGCLTAVAVGTDRNWLVAGTKRGFLTLWDIRFHKMVKAWRHGSGAPMNRLGTSLATLSDNDDQPKPYVLMGCGQNEVSVFDVTKGSCHHCFRVLDPASSYLDRDALPRESTSVPIMTEVPIVSEFKRRSNGVNAAVKGMINENVYPPEPSIQSITGRIGMSGQNYLITGGTDGFIRYWDFSHPSKCFTISGLMNKPRPAYETINTDRDGGGGLTLCRPRPDPKLNEIASDNVPKRKQYGAVRPGNRHLDAVLDIKKIDIPVKGLLSCSRDGVIKFWR